MCTVVEGEDKSWEENKGWSAHWQHIKIDRRDKLRGHFSFTSAEGKLCSLFQDYSRFRTTVVSFRQRFLNIFNHRRGKRQKSCHGLLGRLSYSSLLWICLSLCHGNNILILKRFSHFIIKTCKPLFPSFSLQLICHSTQRLKASFQKWCSQICFFKTSKTDITLIYDTKMCHRHTFCEKWTLFEVEIV